MKKTDQHQLSEWCERIYSKEGQSAVFDFILEYHHDQPWNYCEPCETNSPVTDDRQPTCLVCGSIV